MLTFDLSLVVALVTDDPKLVPAGQTLVNGVVALVFLVSCAVRKRLAEVAADRLTKDSPGTR